MKKLLFLFGLVSLAACGGNAGTKTNINPADYKFDFPDDYNIICSIEENYPRFEGVNYAPYSDEPYWSCVIQNDERAFIYTIRHYGGDPDEINMPNYGMNVLYVFDKKTEKLNKIETGEVSSYKFGVQDGQLAVWSGNLLFSVYDLDSLKLIGAVKPTSDLEEHYNLYVKSGNWSKYPKFTQLELNDVSKDPYLLWQ